MLFKDWRYQDQSSINYSFDKEYVYYVHARAWALKGWLGGTHSWTVFWSSEHSQWVVVEISDKETLTVQQAEILWIQPYAGFFDRVPVISTRVPDAKWFGARPIIVGRSCKTFDYQDIVSACEEYPIKKFRIITDNCNTFTSYLIHRFNLKIERPLRSVGFRNKKYWSIKSIKQCIHNASLN